MREIKFRTWNKKIKKMIDPHKLTPFALHPDCGELNGVFLPFHDDIELMQFTGLHDKNGKEIYEGDIVMDPSGYGGKKIVQWNHGTCRFEFDKMLGYPLYAGSSEKCEVIGNIHETPDLRESSVSG
jgi:uncharacterized phage protein (TIGR01671 family)